VASGCWEKHPLLLLVELQLHYDPKMPRLMQAYAALAGEQYGLPVYSLVFYLLPPSPGVNLPGRYYSEFRGQVARRDFRVVKAWELEAREVVKRGPLALVPLTPLMRGADEDLVRTGAHVQLASQRLKAVSPVAAPQIAANMTSDQED